MKGDVLSQSLLVILYSRDLGQLCELCNLRGGPFQLRGCCKWICLFFALAPRASSHECLRCLVWYWIKSSQGDFFHPLPLRGTVVTLLSVLSNNSLRMNVSSCMFLAILSIPSMIFILATGQNFSTYKANSPKCADKAVLMSPVGFGWDHQTEEWPGFALNLERKYDCFLKDPWNWEF